MRVLGIGDNVADHYLDSNTIYPGGNAFNFAVYAKMQGADAAYLGVFGDDFPGQHVYETARKIGIELERCRILHGENGCPKVKLVNGDRLFVRSNRGGVSRERPPVLDAEDLKYISSFDLLHSSINSFMETELSKMALSGVPVSYDFSNHGTDMYFRAYCPYITYSILSCGHMTEKDTMALISSIHGYGSPYVIATRGGEGAIFSDRGQAHRHVPQRIQIKDTMGAGDAFLTGFLLSWVDWLKSQKEDSGCLSSRLVRQDVIKQSMEKGARFAAKICMLDGAFGHGIVYSEQED